jgi:hypothetical protein
LQELDKTASESEANASIVASELCIALRIRPWIWSLCAISTAESDGEFQYRSREPGKRQIRLCVIGTIRVRREDKSVSRWKL